MPVVTEMQIESIEETLYRGRPASIIQGSAIKNRDCSFSGVEWVLRGEDGSDANVDAFFNDKPTVRHKGAQHWEALIVGVAPYRIPDTRGIVRHECGHFPVTTTLYSGGH
jgi:hypothetical protein